MPQEPHIYKQYAYLSITGHGKSSKITHLLGVEPDEEWSEGDPWLSGPPNNKRFSTNWKLNSGVLELEDLNVHIEEIVRKIKPKRAEVLSLLGEYDVKLVCVSYSLQCFSFELDFALQRELTSLGIRIWFDAYIDYDVHHLVHDLKSQLEHLKK